MRTVKLATLAVLCACALQVRAQEYIRTTPIAQNSSSFEIGPRISNYSTDVHALTPIQTGRQKSFGLIGAYRNGAFVLDFMYDHDPENGFSVADLVVDTGNYSRDRGELTVGFAAAPFLDLQGGFRIDSARVGGILVLGNPVSTDLSIDHQALTAGLRFHTEPAPIGFYAVGRAFVGSAKLDFGQGKVDTDTNGYRGEAGLDIRIGESSWSVQPGYEYDHFQTKNYGVRMNTNRLLLNFVYRRR